MELCYGENLSKVLVVAAHPDDEVLGCGGTIAKHVHHGDKVQVMFMADGFRSRVSGRKRDNLAEEASRILGCEKPILLNLPDNQMDVLPMLDIVQKIERVVNDFQPEIVYTHHCGDLNIDHQLTHKAVMTACRPLPGCCVTEIYSFEVLSATHWQSFSMGSVFSPNYFIDVSNFINQKIEALHCYDNEMKELPHARSYESVENLAKFRGNTIGVKNAEAFCVERIVK